MKSFTENKMSLENYRKHLNTQKKMSQTIIKKCSKEIKLETTLKATGITKLIDNLEKAKIY